MTTLIILIILFAIATISLIIISIKKFSDKKDYILIKLNSLDDKTTTLNDKITSILNKTTKIDSRFITLNEIIKDNLNNIEVAIKGLTNSINAIEEKNNVIVKILEEIAKFNEHHRRVTEMLDNKIIAAKLKREEISNTVHNISEAISIIRQNIEGSAGTKPELQKFNNKLIEFYDELNVIKQTLSNFDEVDCSRHQAIYDILKEIKNIAIDINNTTPNSEDIIDSDELVNRIAEGVYNKSTVISEIDSVLKNLYDKINIILAQVCSQTESIEIPDTLIANVAEEISKKMIEIQAKNSLSNTKTNKPSLHKAKKTGKLKTAVKQDNSQQERIDEIAKQQNK